jgi:hypothetical protein
MPPIEGQLQSVIKLIDAANLNDRIVNLNDLLAVDIKRGAKMLGVSDRHFRKQLDIKGGPIRTVRMGTRLIIPLSSLRDYLNAPAEPAPAEIRPTAVALEQAKPAKTPRARRR